MSRSIPVWVSQSGDSSHTIIADVVKNGTMAVIMTRVLLN